MQDQVESTGVQLDTILASLNIDSDHVQVGLPDDPGSTDDL